MLQLDLLDISALAPAAIIEVLDCITIYTSSSSSLMSIAPGYEIPGVMGNQGMRSRSLHAFHCCLSKHHTFLLLGEAPSAGGISILLAGSTASSLSFWQHTHTYIILSLSHQKISTPSRLKSENLNDTERSFTAPLTTRQTIISSS